MSDDFVPLNQSTPVQGRWPVKNQQQGGYQNNWQHNQRRHGHNKKRWSNNSQHSNNSFGSDYNSSYGRDNKANIDAYLHPSMLRDPWAQLRQNT